MLQLTQPSKTAPM
uniref:Uncharacterized protein n=1 Tax=Anguilla anguilla TaxID=7936 RepID=A0A0E9XLH6_ANGAN